LDEKSLQPPSGGVVESKSDIERNIDAVVEPMGVLLEDIERELAVKSLALEAHGPSEALNNQAAHTESPPWSAEWVLAHMKGLVSDQQVSVRKVDIAAVALEAATAGAVLTGLAIMLLRPR
jgi:hypothetical protein